MARCEAEIHSTKCNGEADNHDHATPRCIAKQIAKDFRGLKKRNRKLYNNASVMKDCNEEVPMSIVCHRLKDSSTPARKQRLKTGFSTLNELKEWRNKNDVRISGHIKNNVIYVFTQLQEEV